MTFLIGFIPLFIILVSILIAKYLRYKAKKDKGPFDDLIHDCIVNKKMSVDQTLHEVRKHINGTKENIRANRLNKLKHIFDGTNESDNL